MKRAAEETDMNTRSAKRNRVDKAQEVAIALFDDLNSDCLVNIFSWLSNDDMNSVAICSKNCREARANDSLDQTRIGTIICTENTTLESIRNSFVSQEWDQSLYRKPNANEDCRSC